MYENAKLRARDLGLPFTGQPGSDNTITDVPGVEVGFCTLHDDDKGVHTGVTAILPRGREDRLHPVSAGRFDLNGNGEVTGSHLIQELGYFFGPICLTNTHSLGIVHHAATAWMIDHYQAYFQRHHAWALPVVAETYDGLVSDICGLHVRKEHALEAIESARPGPVAEGNVGGGTGMQTYEFKGGTGTASRIVGLDGQKYTVGALVQSNFGTRHELNILGVPVGRHLKDNAILTELGLMEQGSIVVIIATDAPLLPVQLQRLAKRGALGIGRTGTSGGHYSGDVMLAFSVANETYLPAIGEQQPVVFTMDWINDAHCDYFYEAAVEAVEEAVINAMVAAESLPTIKPPGHVLEAIDHETLKDVMARFNRLDKPG
jgi:D-aminopeptidase